MIAGEEYCVRESRAEVAAMIAEAQAAERRATALPVMAAVYDAVLGHSCSDAVTNADALLAAIERREREGR